MNHGKRKYSEKMMDMIPVYPHKKGYMSMRDRAARFSPFAALTVHDESVKEKEVLGFEEEHLMEEEYVNFLLLTGGRF